MKQLKELLGYFSFEQLERWRGIVVVLSDTCSPQAVMMGQWIVMDEERHISVLSDTDFNANYDPAPDNGGQDLDAITGMWFAGMDSKEAAE